MTTLLVVDDESLVTDFLSFLLGCEGYTVVVARNGKEALQIVTHKRPELVLTDLMMPVMSGLEFAKAVKQVEALKDLPLILCSAAPGALTDEERQLFAAVLQKPYKPATLLNTMARYVGSGNEGSGADR